MQTSTYIRKGDTVQVMLGRSRGKTGKVLRVDYKKSRLFVEKVNMVKRHLRPNRTNPQGGILEKEASIHWSNVLLVCSKCVKPVRVRSKEVADGKRTRVCVKCGEKVGVL